ncbi:MAG: methylmalonyl-CoA mutase family protein [Streptosporangiales bacterium]
MTADPSVEQQKNETAGSTEDASRANDAELPIRKHYGPLPGDPDLDAWIASRSAAPAPYRPRAMVYVGHQSPQVTGERVRILTELGAESILLACDLPSQLGFDPDHRLSRAQVGRAGVSCATLDDARAIFAATDVAALDSVGMLANSVGHVGLAMVSEVLRERRAGHVGLVMQNDPLKEFTARGTEIFTPEQARRLACDAVAYAIEENLPGYAMTVCSNHYDVAGAGPVVAVAFALSNAISYLDELVIRGYDPAAAARRIMLFLNERSDLFLGAVVFRYTRSLWGNILRDRYGVDPEPVALMGYSHGLETNAEPLVNVPRCAVSVTAAVLGGADYLCAAAYDEALRVPSLDAAALALRTQQVVGNEHGVAMSVDPLAGSHKMEEIGAWFTDQVTAEMARVEANGGGLACIQNGYIVRRIDELRSRRTRQLDSGERVWIGENANRTPQWEQLFQGSSAPASGTADIETDLANRVGAHKREYAGPRLDGCLAEVERCAAGSDNVVPATVRALHVGATIEQLMDATRRGLESAA